jgi:hypothetical protein
MDKIVEKVLLYLDKDTLKQLLVIKPFRRIILNSEKLMKRLPLIIGGRNWDHSRIWAKTLFMSNLKIQ